MQLQVNGEMRDVADNLSLLEFLKFLDLFPERIAIELNQNVVRRAEWSSTTLKEDDRVEIVHFVGGGESRGSNQEAELRGEVLFRVGIAPAGTDYRFSPAKGNSCCRFCFPNIPL